MMVECDDQDYESFLNNFEIMTDSDSEWIFSNSDSLRKPMFPNEYELCNSIVISDSLLAEESLETFIRSPSVSDITTNESSNFSKLKKASFSSMNTQKDQMKIDDQSFTMNSNQTSISSTEIDNISESELYFHSEHNKSFTSYEASDLKFDNSLFNENVNLESNLSYVIMDRASFDSLLKKSQLSQQEAICEYPYSQLISINSINSPSIIPINNMNIGYLANSFQNVVESSPQIVLSHGVKEDIHFDKANKVPVITSQILLQDNQNIDSVPLFFGTDDSNTYSQPQINFPNYSTYSLIDNTVNLTQYDSIQQNNNDLCSTNFSSALSQISSNSSQNNSEYKVETMVISDNEDVNEDQLCLVCGDSASCQHYGVKSCEGCKGFFKRTIQKNASNSYVCLHNQDCVIDKQNRNRCQFCRYVKCIKVGMVKEIVRKESLKGRRGRLSSKVKMKNGNAQSVYTVVNLLSTIKTAIEFSEPKCLEKLTLKELHSIERFQKKMKTEDIMSYITNELHESLKIVKKFAEKLIGFNTLSKRDQTLILVLNGLEFITLRAGLRRFNECITASKTLNEAISGSIILDNGCILTKALLCRSLFNSWSAETQDLSSELAILHNNDKEIVNGILAITLLKIEIDSEESKQLEDASLVYSLRHRYIEVLKTYCNSKMTPESNITSSNKASKKSNSQSSITTKQNYHISDPKFLSKLLDKQMNVQLIVKNHLLKPIIKQYFNTDNISDCDQIFTNLLSGQEIMSFCPRWLFKLIVYKTMPHLCLR